MQSKFLTILNNRSKFTFGTKQAKASDPKAFMGFRKEQAKEPDYSLVQKVENLKVETKENFRKHREDK